VAGCATAPSKGEVRVRPGPQHQATHQVVGESIVASLGGVAVTVQWLSAEGVEGYIAARPGLTSPWPREVWEAAPPTVFLLRVRNQTTEEAQFDPSLASLVTQDGRRNLPVSYEDMYVQLVTTEGSAPRLLTLQAILFSRFLAIPPSGQREGLLVFRTLDPGAKHLLLELATFSIGGRDTPGLFEFQVVRE
jgi:hypothetical protein